MERLAEWLVEWLVVRRKKEPRMLRKLSREELKLLFELGLM